MELTQRIVIVGAKRTPQGRFLGALAKKSAVDLAEVAGLAALGAVVDPDLVDLVVVGNVLSAGQRQNIARQVAMRLEVPRATPAFTVNMMCASGMKAVMLAAQAIRDGEASVVLCGGTESMSNAPYLLERARAGYRLGDGVLVDSLLRDGLVDAFDDEHMGHGAEAIAAQLEITREQQDAFALQSQQRWAAAHEQGMFDAELAPMPELDRDEHARPDTTIEKLASLRPAFVDEGSVTPGNASGINDGAAMLVVCSEETAERNDWEPLARVVDAAAAGCEPRMFGLGPVHAIEKLCDRRGCEPDDFDTVELNEAFAAQTLGCIKQLRLDAESVNPDGGAIAIGHPIGASGARLIVHLAHRLDARRSRRALATLCVGGGMGVAMEMAEV